MSKVYLSYRELRERALLLPLEGKVYGVPQGGVYAALLAASVRDGVTLAEEPDEADCFVDDIIDSGRTRRKYQERYGRLKPFWALVDKLGADSHMGWVVFPWERTQRLDGPQDAVRRIIQYIGDDPDREGLAETPDRVVRSYAELFAGYRTDPASVLKTFLVGYDEMVLLKGVPFCSTCEHHMLPFTGKAHIAYIPNGRVVGLSKLARLLEVFARRLQVQERLTQEVTQALDNYLSPLGSACVIEAAHSCMSCRGVGKQGAVMVTSSLTGAFREPEVRAEFLGLIK